jgi:hypothetical protein
MKHLNKYDNFIVEKLILEQLLLESNIVYSNKFKKVLSKMSDNEIAQKLLEIENKDLEVVSNFFDIKIDDDTILTFTPDRVAQQILTDEKEYVIYQGRRGGWLTNNVETNGAIFARLGFTPKTEEVFQPNNTDTGEVISKVTSKKSGKTWCYVKFPSGEGVYNQDKLRVQVVDKPNLVFKRSRQEIRLGRGARLLLRAYGIPVTDSQIEGFVNDYRAAFSIINDVFSRFEVVEGEQLLYWYNRDRYEFPHMGMLGGSCQSVGRRDWLQIYIDNPQTVNLLILKSENTDEKIVGRALLWKLDDGRTMMDQIYTSKDSDVRVFREYAAAKGYVEVNYGTTFTAHIKPEEFDKYPSVDNMRQWNPATGQISNKTFRGSKEIIWSDEEDDDEDFFDDDDYDDDDN